MPLLGLGFLDDNLFTSLLVALEAAIVELAADDRRM